MNTELCITEHTHLCAVPANISEGPVDTEFPVGSVAWLVCYATGVPLPLLTWSLVKENGSQQLLDDLSLTNKYTITTIQDTEGNVASSNLTFPHFQPSDIGRYACNAMNGVTLPQGYTQYQQAYLDLQPGACHVHYLARHAVLNSSSLCIPRNTSCVLYIYLLYEYLYPNNLWCADSSIPIHAYTYLYPACVQLSAALMRCCALVVLSVYSSL